MSVREMVYPNLEVEVSDVGNVRLRFYTPGSKFGAVHVVLRADVAGELRQALGKALVTSHDGRTA